MKNTTQFIIALVVAVVVWYGYEVYSINSENAAVHLQQLEAVDQE